MAHDANAPSLTAAQVAHVAKLAKLELALAAVLAHIARIDALDVAGIEPMAHPFESHNRLDDDLPESPLSIEAVLMNAPATEGRFLAVPKVLAEES